MKRRRRLAVALAISLAAAGCSGDGGARGTSTAAAAPPVTSPAPRSTAATGTTTVPGLSEAQVASLLTLEQVDDHPLYTMHHYAPGSPVMVEAAAATTAPAGRPDGWACSLFAALADPEAKVFGRNFDWDFSPALLLFNHPEDGFASASMVDIHYLGFPEDASAGLTSRPLDELVGLLDAPLIPFDGMNEAGLAVGMAAVPEASVRRDPAKETVDSLGIIRLMLDGAATVEEALGIMRNHNVDFEGQTPLHYLMADASGDAALVEYVGGELRVVRSDDGWHQATNFLRSEVDSPEGSCARHDTIARELESAAGLLDAEGALSLLAEVAQPHTQWSVVYGIDTGEIRVVMGRHYERVHTFVSGLGSR